MGRGHDESGEEESLAEMFMSVGRSMRRVSAESLARWDVTPGQARALHVLQRHGSIRLSALAQHLHIAPRSVTEVADDLEGKGLIRRLPDPDDRRATLATLTEHGSRVQAAIRRARAAGSERVFDRLTERERASLARILRKLRTDTS